MSEKPSPLLPDDEQSRDRLRAVLTIFCVVAVVLAGSVIPAIPGAGLGGTPLGSVVPQPSKNPFGQQPGGAGSPGGLGGAGGLGALNPGQQTSVGGSLADNQSAFQSQNAEVHFTVQSSTSTYWRTGAYDTYTGSGWEQTGDSQPYTGPLDSGGIEGKQVEYQVTLGQSASALPSVWRPNSVSQSGSLSESGSLSVTDKRAFVSEEPLGAGTTYSGVSTIPARNPTVLKTTGQDYPAEIERKYTALPEDTDPRIEAFTSDLTADADSPYESATQIESWLEANKNYSLNVSPPSEDVASQFIFDMEKGYCEYYASAMTVMLRSQGVPARYVVGYSTGQQVSEDTYKVRGMNAHAWVEVYFEEVGWVRFDPTPGQSRLESEQQAFENQTDSGDYEPNESGSPGEAFSPNESSETATETNLTATTSGTGEFDDTTTGDLPTSGDETATDSEDSTPTDGTSQTTRDKETTRTTTDDSQNDTDDSQSDTDDSSTDSEYEVELNRTPVPGATVQVTVRQNGALVSDIPVAFNDEFIGRTDGEGTVTGQVPYEENLIITLGQQATDDSAAMASPPLALSVPDLDVPMALTGPPPRALLLSYEATQANETNGTDQTEYSLETTVTLTVSGDVASGNEVVVTATVQDVPVRDAEVKLDGERVGTTDQNGRVRVQLPESTGNTTIEVSRESVSGEKMVYIPRLNVSVEPGLPLALPGTPAEICATYGGDPISDAQIQLADQNLTTDFNGSATASLPFTQNAVVVVSAHDQTTQTTVSGLLVNLFAFLGGATLLLGGLGFGAYRRGFGPRRLAGLLLAGLTALPRLVVAVLFGLADRLEWAVSTVIEAFQELLAGETTVGELLGRFQVWLRTWFQEKASAVEETAQFGRFGNTSAQAAREREDDSYRTLREAWQSFLGTVSVRRPGGKTPGELADHAVQTDDLPSGAVVTLRDAFRDVEYGARSPADRLPRVEEAIETIEHTTREDDQTGAEEAGNAPTGPDTDQSEEGA